MAAAQRGTAGRALAGRQGEAVVATKFGHAFDAPTRQMLGVDASPAYIRRAGGGQPQRLGRDCIDLYQLHVGEYAPEHLEDVCDVLDRLVAAGKIRAYGWCTWPDRIEGARGVRGAAGVCLDPVRRQRAAGRAGDDGSV
jgi:aryl-alcohol dehydrogenase-like predicted oxidoreductase